MNARNSFHIISQFIWRRRVRLSSIILTRRPLVSIMADENPDEHPKGTIAGDPLPIAPNGGNKREDINYMITASSSSSSVTEGLYSLISPVIIDFDSRAEATARSQEELSFALDRLTGGGATSFDIILTSLCCSELDKLLEDAPSPFIMQHAARISGVRKRVKALNTVLKSIQRRIDKMDRMLSAGLVQDSYSDFLENSVYVQKIWMLEAVGNRNMLYNRGEYGLMNRLRFQVSRHNDVDWIHSLEASQFSFSSFSRKSE
ncbi:hypothetical protein BUALT_Bualt04G0044000 [Buddleja alternifolia]|uniref:Biogenesis of lysosome-related organelles complex 1 subunit 7 n=1 Tax=Buddleja alternifolia TaxID=168488 RepID=A0AAV6XN97_9LAMI|nr:hypothetical protein BUALT_Bualt04G0044000 [Buddleja alternifolia]